MLSVMGVMAGDGRPSPALPTGSKAELKCDEVMTIHPIANKLQSNCWWVLVIERLKCAITSSPASHLEKFGDYWQYWALLCDGRVMVCDDCPSHPTDSSQKWKTLELSGLFATFRLWFGRLMVKLLHKHDTSMTQAWQNWKTIIIHNYREWTIELIPKYWKIKNLSPMWLGCYIW